MPDYRLTVTFGAADDRQARKRADDIADLCATEHGTHDAVVVPADGELRDRLGKALMAAFDKTAIVCDHTQMVQFAPLADAALAVRDAELERLRSEINRLADYGLKHREQRDEAIRERDELRKLLPVSHHPSDGYRNALAAAIVDLAEQRQRAERAETAIERVRTLCREPYTAAYDLQRDILAELPDAPSGADSHPQPVEHIGGRANAEDCPACSGTHPPYPFICPGNAPQSPASGRTPVPPGTEPPHPPHDAQEAAQDAPTTEQIWDYLRRNPQHFRVLIGRDMDGRPDWWRARFAKEARIAGATDPLGRHQ